jgi:DNA-binding LacI/PurR family transcriptional regulator
MSRNTPTVEAIDSRQVAEILRHSILEGEFSPTEPFPSLRELSRRHGIGTRTARTATDILVKEGLLYRRERSGTFVRLVSNGETRSPGSCALRCVNVLERTTGTLPSFVRTDYLQGYTQALDAVDAKMRVSGLPGDIDRLRTVFSDQFRYQEQACILVNIISPDILDWLNDHAVPFVVQHYVCYRKAGLPPHHSVAVNKVGGAFRATEYLIQLGHRRIGYAGYVPGDPDPLLEVYEGYVAAMHCAGLEPLDEDVMPVNTDEPPSAYEPALRWLRERDLPSAIVARTDAAAIGIVRAARTLGLRVPADLSVVGFNDQPEAREMDPPLTTVAVPRTQLGRAAVDLLLATAGRKQDEPETRVLACQLVTRRSAAPPGRDV